MRFQFEVGLIERHKVEVRREWWTGTISILVDGSRVICCIQAWENDLNNFSRPGGIVGNVRYLADVAAGQPGLTMTRVYEFTVGTQQQQTVRIEKARPKFLAAARPHHDRVFVDDPFFFDCFR